MPAGKHLKRLREGQLHKISAEKAAVYIGVNAGRYTKWEQRDVDPKDTGDIEKVESYFNCSLKNLEKLENFQFYERKRTTKIEIKESILQSQNIRNAAMLTVVLDAQAEILANQTNRSVSEMRTSLEAAVKKTEAGLLSELSSL